MTTIMACEETKKIILPELSKPIPIRIFVQIRIFVPIRIFAHN